MGDVRPALEQADVDRDLAACRAHLGEAASQEARATGQDLTFDGAFSVVIEALPE
jgi:hypothetical protein